ncbi:hypothetical protein B4U79_14840, partial [Dinothrombium tinctorium]
REAFQPEQPQILDEHITPESKFTFVDFVPSVIKRSSTAVITTAEVEYHTFRVMVETANLWLQRNVQWEVVNCETVILLYKYNDRGSYYELKPNDSTFYIYGSEKNNVLRALRLWIKKRIEVVDKDVSEICQVINYMDVIPLNKDDGDFSGSKFENLDELIDRVNTTIIKNNGIEGRIITIETLQCEAGIDWKVDPEVSLSSLSTKNIYILRIFYEQGIVDFVPRHISGGGFFRKPKFESLSEVMSRATKWLANNSTLNFKNAQSVDIKLKSLTALDTKTMSYTEHGDYLRIFRIAFTKPFIEPNIDEAGSSSSSIATEPTPIYLASKLFMASKKHETIRDIGLKIEDWANQTLKADSQSNKSDGNETQPVRVLGAETVEVFCKTDDNDKERAVDDTFQYNRFGTKNGYLFMTFRVYFDIGYQGYARISGASRE